MTKTVIFGEVLFDHFPDESVVLGGAPFNVAWHLQAFALSPLFISRVGDDALGGQILSEMQEWGMDLSGVQIDREHPTGTVQISIEDDQPSFEILSDQAYDFIDKNDLPSVANAALLYHGSLAMRNSVSREALNKLRHNLDCPVFVDVNLRAPWWQKETVIAQLESAQWAKLNDDELCQLTDAEGSLEFRAQRLQEATGLSLLIVTLGAQGAFARTLDGEIFNVEPEAGITVVDTVGAGDAFTAVIVLGLISGWPLATSLQRAQSFASKVVGIRGATPLDKHFYENFTAIWSQD